MQAPLPKVTDDFGQRTPLVIHCVIDVQIDHLHFRRKRIERLQPALVRGHDRQVVASLPDKPAEFVEQDPLHPARMVDRSDAVDEFHAVLTGGASLSPSIQKSNASIRKMSVATFAQTINVTAVSSRAGMAKRLNLEINDK